MSGAGEARLFAALELASEPALSLRGWAREVAAGLGRDGRGAGLRVLEAESLHLTLCFLGARPAGEIGELASAMAEACQGVAAFELSLGAPVWLAPWRPRALAVEVHDPAGALAGLQAAVSGALAQAGAGEQPGRRFRPHITVVRAGGRFTGPARIALPPTPAVSFNAERVALIRSWLEPQGARYEAQSTVRLGPVAG